MPPNLSALRAHRQDPTSSAKRCSARSRVWQGSMHHRPGITSSFGAVDGGEITEVPKQGALSLAWPARWWSTLGRVARCWVRWALGGERIQPAVNEQRECLAGRDTTLAIKFHRCLRLVFRHPVGLLARPPVHTSTGTSSRDPRGSGLTSGGQPDHVMQPWSFPALWCCGAQPHFSRHALL